MLNLRRCLFCCDHDEIDFHDLEEALNRASEKFPGSNSSNWKSSECSETKTNVLNRVISNLLKTTISQSRWCTKCNNTNCIDTKQIAIIQHNEHKL